MSDLVRAYEEIKSKRILLEAELNERLKFKNFGVYLTKRSRCKTELAKAKNDLNEVNLDIEAYSNSVKETDLSDLLESTILSKLKIEAKIVELSEEIESLHIITTNYSETIKSMKNAVDTYAGIEKTYFELLGSGSVNP